MKKYIVNTLLLCILAAGHVQAQDFSKTEMLAAINKIAVLLEKNYVSEAKGKAIADHLLQEQRQGAFDKVSSWKEMDTLTTGILKRFSHDGHLYVRNKPAVAKSLLTKDTTADAGDDMFFYGPQAAINNYGFRETRILEDNIGYIRLSEINISRKSLALLNATMLFVANTRALIIDLRDNVGGGSDVDAVFESFFLPPGKTILISRNRTGIEEKVKTVNWLTQPAYTKPVYVLINKKTVSAGEEIPFVLQKNNRAKIIGQTSAGAANMNTFLYVNDALFLSVSIAATTYPGTTDSWEGKGVEPDYTTAPGEELERAKKLCEEEKR
ncbi:peptidase S41-like protein [Chitinophaga niastensis]|uniref:Peptidase S41-like protein n=1 Tax=Chitinophaga niastensis TaxID=536980 RepID=A0A2P8HQ38_CHINA|nr:S41 family peptidase [Chitinophaga niastensis]PSL48325.1 peptidase S41-like protein [Chitinophaga niastensis]